MKCRPRRSIQVDAQQGIRVAPQKCRLSTCSGPPDIYGLLATMRRAFLVAADRCQKLIFLFAIAYRYHFTTSLKSHFYCLMWVYWLLALALLRRRIFSFAVLSSWDGLSLSAVGADRSSLSLSRKMPVGNMPSLACRDMFRISRYFDVSRMLTQNTYDVSHRAGPITLLNMHYFGHLLLVACAIIHHYFQAYLMALII